jgi:glycosyltransferase involved in cell wall biosynthesis
VIQVSAVIIAHNEEAQIGRCLASLIWVDEIVVIDSYSSDQTVQICQNPSQPWASKISVIQRKWSGFKDQRNFAIQQPKHDWILVVDADEACSPELAEKVRSLLSQVNGPPFRAYKVRRVEYLLGKPIHYGTWNPSYQDRFFHRKGVRYINEVHEYPVFPTPPAELHEPLHHCPNLTPEKILNKMNFYTSIEARDRFAQGKRTNWFHLIATFPAMSVKTYFYYGSYKDGMHGVVVALLDGISRLVRHIKLWQLQLEDRSKKT